MRTLLRVDNGPYPIIMKRGVTGYVVEYGKDVRYGLTKEQAFERLKGCLHHALECESELDTPDSKGYGVDVQGSEALQVAIGGESLPAGSAEG